MKTNRPSWLAIVCLGALIPLALGAPARPRRGTPAPTPAAAVPVMPRGSEPAEWTIFRHVYPFHIQGVALSAPRPDGSRLLVVAEPPPQVTESALRALDPALAKGQRCTQPIGHDGWVQDFVATVPPADAGEVSRLCTRINTLLFGTSYKATVFPIPATAPRGPQIRLGQSGLDLRVSGSDLRRWLLDQAMDLVPALGGAPVKLRALLDRAERGVYFTAQEGLVVWVLPNQADVSIQGFAARQFALDSDLVLGAISGERATAIVARERSTPVDVLPPLRAETIFQLATARTAHLAQSYERNNAFAGRFDEQHDWAPIYLSRQLVDTEYGSLLNITDQLLKSWSNAGRTKYENFLYPDPARYPFAKAVYEELGVKGITYNWNTRGAGYALDGGPYLLLALNRTGALPVSYIPGDGAGADATMRAEDAAYNYFASLGDPNLTRVVQYAALYQAFVNLNIGVAGKEDAAPTQRVHPLLLTEMIRLYLKLDAADDDKLAEMCKPAIERLLAEFRPGIIDDIKRDAATKRIRLTEEQRSQYVEEAIEDNRKSQSVKMLADVKAALEILRAHVKSATGLQTGLEGILLEHKTEADRRAVRALQRLTDLERLREQMVSAGAATAKGWIHTPVVVVSWNQGPEGANFVGGHNLDADLSVFHEAPGQPPGRIALRRTENGGYQVEFNPADRDRVSDIVRDVGRRERDLPTLFPEVQRQFAATSARPARPPQVTPRRDGPTRPANVD